jgi:hypothetical protein
MPYILDMEKEINMFITPREEGYLAYWMGAEDSENPFIEGSECYWDWNAGWETADLDCDDMKREMKAA